MVDRLRRRTGRQNVRRADQPEGAEHGQNFALAVALGEAFKLRKLVERGMGMTILLGNLDNRMKILQLLFDEFRIALQHGVGNIGARVDFAALHRDIKLETGITGDEFGLLEAKYPREQPPVDVDVVADGLSADPKVGAGA